MIYYLLIGMALIFTVEYLTEQNHNLFASEEDKIKFDNYHRVLGILFWPVLVIYAIKNMLK